jgi:hypothetical protein
LSADEPLPPHPSHVPRHAHLGGRARVEQASRASKANAANKLFVSPAAALAGLAHPGDSARVVRVNVSPAFWMQHFGAGQLEIDLRHV